MAPSQPSPSARKRKGKPDERPPQLTKPKTSKNKAAQSDSGQDGGCMKQCLMYLLYAFCLLLVPPILNHAALNKEESVIKEEGLPYDIGWNQKLFLKCVGEGSPTVILEAPIGQSSEVWFAIQPALAKVTRVCSYDRAGLGLSERPHKNLTEEDNKRRGPESTIERMVSDLHYLITSSSDQPKPFILVGAEFGALVARFYAQIYENEVSNIVLVDPLVEVLFEEDNGIWSELWSSHLIPSKIAMQFGAATGLTRLALILRLLDLPIKAHNVPEEVVLRQKHLMCRPAHQSAAVDEHYFINESFAQMRTVYKVKPFPSNVSVTIVSGNYHDDELPSVLNEAWESSVEFLLSSVHPGAKHVRINGSDGHMIYRKPKEVIDIIKKLIKKWRDSNKERIKEENLPSNDS